MSLLAALMWLASAEAADFDTFAATYSKVYSSDAEYVRRAMIFQRNVAFIANSSSLYGAGVKLGLNQFSDLTASEFKERVLMRTCGSKQQVTHELYDHAVTSSFNDIPTSFDWRSTAGVVQPVKDQGTVGSCWAFSTVANIEGQHFLTHGQSISLSEEFLVDCDDLDCSVFGGWPYNAYQYILERKGLPSEESFPYCSGQKESCYPCMENKNKTYCGPPPSFCNKTWNPSHCLDGTWTAAASIKNWTYVSKNETEIAAYLVQRGPLSVLIDALGLQRYKSGVWDPESKVFGCKSDGTGLDHAVTLVGFGVDKAKEYWLVKNSWGQKWGEEGYFRIARGQGKCGINTQVTSSLM